MELVRHVVTRSNYRVNDLLKGSIVAMFFRLKDLNIPNKGSLVLLNLFGSNPMQTIEEYRKAYESGILEAEFFPE